MKWNNSLVENVDVHWDLPSIKLKYRADKKLRVRLKYNTGDDEVKIIVEEGENLPEYADIPVCILDNFIQQLKHIKWLSTFGPRDETQYWPTDETDD